MKAKQYTKKENLQVLIIVIISLFACFASCSPRYTLCDHLRAGKIQGFK